LELRETRQALEGQEKQLAQQAATLRQQSVEDTFFRMLLMFRQMATTVRHPGEPEVGVDYWRRFVKTIAKDDAIIKAYVNTDAFDGAWTVIYRQWEPTLGPYFARLPNC
jgi:hypothetical protein